MTMDNGPQRAIAVDYTIRSASREAAVRKAYGIALEQTVELAHDHVSERIRRNWVGDVVRLEPDSEERWHCRILYNPELAGGELSQLLNTLFGNISLQDGIRLDAVHWPEELLRQFGGPAHGISGMRARLCVPPSLPLTCTALKPVGTAPHELAELAYRFALGGVDIVKDDHGIANQPCAPYRERLQACQEAVTRANALADGRTLYFPNATAPPQRLADRLAAARDAGCFGVLLSPWICGLDSIRWARDEFGLAVMAHPALTGACFRNSHGIAPDLLLGALFRIAGADASIYPNVGGRFGFSLETCEAINQRLREPLGGLRTALPTPGGGMSVGDAPDWIRRYGPDTMVLIGGSLYAQGDITAATRHLLQALGR